ncbi:MAG: anthranilate synthase component I [Gammaproteobacteria bacterium]|nr:anthranilate synthase component I [Gammaproteobacteria bacterium]
MNKSDLRNYAAQGYNRVPLAREILADLDTPVSTYIKLAARPYSYLLESVQGGEKWGRYSIIGLPCQTVLRVVDLEVTIEVDGRIVERMTMEDPLEMVREFCGRYRVPVISGLPRFTGGIVGYFGYDTVRYIEPHLGLCQKPDPTGTPDILLMVSEEVLVFDNLTGRLHLITHIDPHLDGAFEDGTDRLDHLVEQLRENSLLYVDDGVPVAYGENSFTSGFTEPEFEDAVERSREYIRNGDIMQVVLSQRLSIELRADPIDVYRALRTLNPSPYMYFLDLDGFRIVGSSPEILVRCEDGKVTVRPIAGTRRRGHTDEEDRAFERELLADPKELAEHLMLVDLGRNDVGRVARIGSVSVTERMLIERYSHVMHIVSNVEGKLRPGLDAVDVLRATFPAGTVSGAPKVRAMEIIDELEPEKRGIYAGAVGYISWTGNMDTAIAIRTAVITGEMLHIQAGAGIVADSIPEREWKETMNKGRAIFRAVEMAGRGLDRDLSEFN